MRTRFILLALVTLSLSLAAHADTIVTYNISAATEYYAPTIVGTVTGTFALDYTNYLGSSANLTFQSNTVTTVNQGPFGPFYPGPYTATWTGPVSAVPGRMSGPVFIPFSFDFLNSVGDEVLLSLEETDNPSYAGGPICSLNDLCSAGTGSFYSEVIFPLSYGGSIQEPFTSGTATIATTPEPPSLALLLPGLLALFAAFRFRPTPVSR